MGAHRQANPVSATHGAYTQSFSFLDRWSVAQVSRLRAVGSKPEAFV